jgi:hypothetical protein
VYVGGGSTALTDCTFAEGAGSHTDSVWNSGTTTFACPKGATGTPVVMKAVELEANQLPPAKEVVHCTKAPQ